MHPWLVRLVLAAAPGTAPVATEPTAIEPTATEPTANEPTANESTAIEPAVNEPATAERSAPNDPVLPTATLAEHRRRTTLGLAGMGTLTGWAVVNIVGGLAGNLTTTGTVRFFHQGNAAWNTVNLALGIAGLVSQRRERRTPVDAATGRSRARRAQRVFGINAGLDVLYVSTGAILWPLGRDRASPRAHGYGQALVLQGAFLFVFDVAMMLGHERLIVRAERAAPDRPRLRPVVALDDRGRLAPGLALCMRR